MPQKSPVPVRDDQCRHLTPLLWVPWIHRGIAQCIGCPSLFSAPCCSPKRLPCAPGHHAAQRLLLCFVTTHHSSPRYWMMWFSGETVAGATWAMEDGRGLNWFLAGDRRRRSGFRPSRPNGCGLAGSRLGGDSG